MSLLLSCVLRFRKSAYRLSMSCHIGTALMRMCRRTQNSLFSAAAACEPFAERASVSIGSLDQYFFDKQAIAERDKIVAVIVKSLNEVDPAARRSCAVPGRGGQPQEEAGYAADGAGRGVRADARADGRDPCGGDRELTASCRCLERIDPSAPRGRLSCRSIVDDHRTADRSDVRTSPSASWRRCNKRRSSAARHHLFARIKGPVRIG
jgi:hypothetical protein